MQKIIHKFDTDVQKHLRDKGFSEKRKSINGILSKCINKDKKKEFEEVLRYVFENNKRFKFNLTTRKSTLLLYALDCEDELVHRLFRHILNEISNKTININKKDKTKDYPLLKAARLKRMYIVKYLKEYASNAKIVLNINDSN